MSRGPTPGPEGESRQLNSGWVELPASGRPGPAPSLSLAGAGLSKDEQVWARKLWATWWSSPMALMWSEFDRPQIERLLILTARARSGASAFGISEIRQLEDRFGLNPTARRRLYWRIQGVDLPSTDAADLPATTSERAALPSAGGQADPRLRMLKGGKAAG